MSVLNSVIDNLGVELHAPGGYQYCGPGTKLKKRLTRGDPGINPLDRACREHDIAYSQNKDLKSRHEADKVLVSKAWKRVKAKDSSLGERLTSLGVAGIMKAKVKLGLGRKKNSFKKYVKNIISAIKRSPSSGNKIKDALKIAKKLKGKNFKAPYGRIITLKQGGFLPFLIPLFAGLSALGSIAGGASGIARAVINAKDAKAKLEEAKRHNEKMEQMHIGKGLYLKPFKSGCGLYLRPCTSGSGLKKKSTSQKGAN